MTSKRIYYLMLGLIGLLFIGLLAGAYGANQILTKQALEVTALKAKNSALDQEQASLVIAKKQADKYRGLNSIVGAIVPQDKDQAVAVREIINIAKASNINSLGSITFPSSTLGSSTVVAASSTAGTAVAKPFSSTGTDKTNALSQLQPVKNITGVYVLKITVSGDPTHPVSYSQLISFLAGLENNRRTAQVSSISFVPDAKDASKVSFSLTLEEYIKP
ncbi:MAG: hypothetical protein ABIV43_03980 [Candidatus Saccharimonadales bacterium]